jgi:hypothetical protein
MKGQKSMWVLNKVIWYWLNLYYIEMLERCRKKEGGDRKKGWNAWGGGGEVRRRKEGVVREKRRRSEE